MANVEFRGDAVAFAKVVQTTVTGTWATSDVANVTINEKTLAVTIGSSVTVTDVAAAVVAAFNGAAVVNDETRNFTGDEEPDFSEITASNVAGVISFTGDTDGLDFTVTVSETTAGSGSMGTPSTTTAPKGDNALVAENMVGGALPSAADDLTIEASSTDILYSLDSLSGTALGTLYIKGSYTGDIGLRRNNASGYIEYRTQELTVDVDDCEIGAGSGDGSGFMRINFQSAAVNVKVYNTNTAEEDDRHALQIRGTSITTLETEGSSTVDLAAYVGDAATVTTLTADGSSTVRTSPTTTLTTVNAGTDATVEIHSEASLSAITTINIRGNATVILSGDNAVTTVNILDNGTLDDRGEGTITNLNRGPDANYTTANSSVAAGARIVTNATFEAGAGEINDAGKKVTWSNAIDFGLADPFTDFGNLTLGDDIDLTVS